MQKKNTKIPLNVKDQDQMSTKLNHFQGSPLHIFIAGYIRLWSAVFSYWADRQTELSLEQFRRSLKTHLYKHIFGYWQLQRRVTVFFVRWAQIDLLTYLLTYASEIQPLVSNTQSLLDTQTSYRTFFCSWASDFSSFLAWLCVFLMSSRVLVSWCSSCLNSSFFSSHNFVNSSNFLTHTYKVRP